MAIIYTANIIQDLRVGDHICHNNPGDIYEILSWPEQGNDIRIRQVNSGRGSSNIGYYKNYLTENGWHKVNTIEEREVRRIGIYLKSLGPENIAGINELLVRLDI